jgi:Lipid A 3-O-deacylase (PagL)
MLRKLKLLAVVLIILAKNSFAQTNNDQLEFTAIKAISVFTPGNYNLKGTVWGGELGWHFNMADNKADYIRMLGISSIDIIGGYRNYQSLLINNAAKGSLGDVYSIIGRLEIPVFKAGPVKLLFTPGLGFAYSTISYFDNSSPLVGSRLNLAAQGGLKLFTSITSTTGIQAGIDIFHYSNVGVRVPNFGINSYNISLGLVQNIGQKGPPASQQPFVYDHKSSFEFGGDVGMRGVYESKKELHRAGLYAGYSYRLSPVISLKGGVDAGYYFTPFDPKNFNATFAEYGSSYDKWRAGISLGADLMLGRLAVMAAYGYYLHYNSYYNNKTYWTPGLKYYVLPWVALQAKAYIHNTDADYLGVGLLFRVHP